MSLAKPVAANTKTKLDIAKLIRLSAKNAVCTTFFAVSLKGQQFFAPATIPVIPVAKARHPPHKPPPICKIIKTSSNIY